MKYRCCNSKTATSCPETACTHKMILWVWRLRL